MKKRVALHFSRAGETYARAADVQREVAGQCAALLPAGHFPLAVEIGAGGGVFTEALAERLSWDRYVGLDIAPGMLRAAAPRAEALYVAGDGEAAPLAPGRADLLVSSSTMQWYERPEHSLPANLRLLRLGGRFAIGMFVRGTLAELARVSRETGFGSVAPLPDVRDILAILSLMRDVRYGFQTVSYARTYPSVREFLRRIQETGATSTQRKRPFSRERWRAFQERYADLFGEGGGVRSTYRVLYLWGERCAGR
ncbi:methyltransferase domain-containing protein [Desulfocurvus sp. DL9XJH121]